MYMNFYEKLPIKHHLENEKTQKYHRVYINFVSIMLEISMAKNLYE